MHCEVPLLRYDGSVTKAADVVNSVRKDLAAIDPEANVHGESEDMPWFVAEGPARLRVGARPLDHGYQQPSAIEVETSWLQRLSDFRSMRFHLARHASLSALYDKNSSHPACAYARVIVRPSDTVEELTRLVSAVVLTQQAEVQSLIAPIGQHQHHYRLAAVARLMAASQFDVEFSFNGDLDQHEQRWNAAGHRVTRRGEYCQVFARGTPPILLSALLGEHPSWGPGVQVIASVPGNYRDHEAEHLTFLDDTLDEDRSALCPPTGADLLGSWCISPNDDAPPAFVSFVPQAMAYPGVLARIIDQSLGRFDWLGRLVADNLS
jgi:hypothetical protein